MANKNIKINLETKEIIVAKGFYKKASVYGSPEYYVLQNCRKDYPDFTSTVRSIKKAENKESYKGLTYAYIENYIKTHANAEKRMAEYKELRLISECHTVRYPKIKNWFLETYSEVAQYGLYKAEPTVIQMPEINQTEEKIS